MYIKNRLISLVAKLVVALCSGFSLLLYSGLFQGAPSLDMFKYYSVLATALVFIYYVPAAIGCGYRINKFGLKGSYTFSPPFRGAVIVAVVFSFLLTHVFQPGVSGAMDAVAGPVATFLSQIFVPLLVVADYALFDRKGRFVMGDPPSWLLVPFLYYGYLLVASQLGVTYPNGSNFPYGFIDPDLIGWVRVLGNVVLFAAIYLAAGYILFGIDRLLGLLVKNARKGLDGKAETDGENNKQNTTDSDISAAKTAPEQNAAPQQLQPAAASGPAATAPTLQEIYNEPWPPKKN